MTDLHDWITQQVEQRQREAREGRLLLDEEGRYLQHAPVDDPAAALRRCDADRRVLARHTPHSSGSTNCVVRCQRAHHGLQVCNHDGHHWPCDDITDLATAHGWIGDTSNSKEQA
ncbi:DUF6221 family protein [Streptomyces liliifuscus]|uniref:Uncharacterized protein n=1 Tax=Streptomyces liliifuscus TaxID=2797636 RepID=A0A7T7L2G8_9ACTN|nr:DUF6221 family protein [Streptomyces liliifuscus]QQM45219.1 hypothetical protein JEQ17_41310 [Streptomyces liliifuscus]